MDALILTPDLLVSDLLARSPKLWSLFVEKRLDCIGCSMAKFCTLEEVSAQYALDLDKFIREIQERI